MDWAKMLGKNSRAWVLGLLVVAAAPLAGCLDGGKMLAAPAPNWKSGYTFEYTATGESDITTVHDGPPRKRTSSSTNLPVLQEVFNTTMRYADEPLYVMAVQTVQTQADLEGPAEDPDEPSFSIRPVWAQAQRQRDLAPVDTSLSTTFTCNPDRCALWVTGLRFSDNPKWTLLKFPLTASETWTGETPSGWTTTDFVGRNSTSLMFNHTSRVVGGVTVAGPEGSVKAVRIHKTYEFQDLPGFRSLVEAEARRLGIVIDRFVLEHSMEETYDYSPAFENVVQSTARLRNEVVFTGKDADGVAFDRQLHATLSVHVQLTGVSRVVRAERDLNYLGGLMTGAISPLGGPSGKPPPYSIQIEPPMGRVNVAAGEAASFGAKLIGANASLPSDHTLRWRILDGAGASVQEGEGLTFQASPAQPGRYWVEARAVQADGQAVDVATASLEAYWKKSLTQECPLVASEPFLPGCATLSLPVRTGVSRLDVVARPTGPATVNTGELRLTDPIGFRTTRTTPTAGAYQITLEGPSLWGRVINDQDWKVQFYQTRGVAQAIAYEFDIQFGPQKAPEPGGMASVDPAARWARQAGLVLPRSEWVPLGD